MYLTKVACRHGFGLARQAESVRCVTPFQKGRRPRGGNSQKETWESEFVSVPQTRTPEMLDAAKYDALAEDAAGVWASMLEAWLQRSVGNSDSGSG